jgi:hypothetical protein
LKKPVVRTIRKYLQVREVVGEVISQRDPNCIYSARRILVQPIFEALEGKWGNQMNV